MSYILVHSDDYLAHHGILGQKWGVRRYQNKDGTLTNAGRRRYSKLLKDENFKNNLDNYDTKRENFKKLKKDYFNYVNLTSKEVHAKADIDSLNDLTEWYKKNKLKEKVSDEELREIVYRESHDDPETYLKWLDINGKYVKRYEKDFEKNHPDIMKQLRKDRLIDNYRDSIDEYRDAAYEVANSFFNKKIDKVLNIGDVYDLSNMILDKYKNVKI